MSRDVIFLESESESVEGNTRQFRNDKVERNDLEKEE